MSIRPAMVIVVLLGFVACGCRRTPPPESVQPAESENRTATPATIRTESGIDMVLIPAGEFLMGDDRGEDDEQPAHTVRVSSFYMDVCEVTQESFQTMMGRNPSKWQDPAKPVERMSWYFAIQYCNMRSTREGLRPCYDLKTGRCDFAADGYRLPTEAEWEYACRAGTATHYSFGDDPAELADFAWYKNNSGATTHAVKQKRPNPWGLYDMHGNVAEWCNDFYAENYAAGPAQDPTGPEAGEDRVLRGGNWKTSEDSCRCSARNYEAPGLADVCFGYEAYGFRCVRAATGQTEATIEQDPAKTSEDTASTSEQDTK